MTRYIVTRQNTDGSYDSAGMNNRCIISGYKSFNTAFRYGIKPFGNGRMVRVEVFNDNIFSDPIGSPTFLSTK